MGSQFIASRCAHIDTVGSNVLIRGNMPLVGSRYAYDEIASASGVDLTGRHLIEMPIIDNVGERWEFSAILRAFEADPGQYPESFWPWWLQSDYDPNWLQGTRVTSGGRSHPGSFVWRPFEGLPEPPGTPRSCRGRCRPCEPPRNTNAFSEASWAAQNSSSFSEVVARLGVKLTLEVDRALVPGVDLAEGPAATVAEALLGVRDRPAARVHHLVVCLEFAHVLSTRGRAVLQPRIFRSGVNQS